MDIKTIRELVQSNDLIQTNMQELQLSLEKLSDISVELQHMSEEVRQKAKETINWPLDVLLHDYMSMITNTSGLPSTSSWICMLE